MHQNGLPCSLCSQPKAVPDKKQNQRRRKPVSSAEVAGSQEVEGAQEVMSVVAEDGVCVLLIVVN